ncbi:hypothetical protein NIES267_62250 [Calothrix parasitica NIES-267]|uniref:HEAT repeat domain-containing protein n=1 Tax=Calothrix parasitica NIES-267 TaxID=1973488 RepID=A0A1Z4LZQ9_9CYAN|nr:hypothetical protein NIES267_62250 [Calothrix parasitica NIES-267]
MTLTLMSCSLLPHTINAASVQPKNQLEANTNIKQPTKKESKQKQAAEIYISSLIEIIETKYRLYKLEDSPEAKAASQELVKIGKTAVPELINAFRKNRIFLTFGVAETLSKIAHKDSSVVAILINKLGDNDLQVRFGAMKVLENDSFVPELKKATQNKNPNSKYIVIGAVNALQKIDSIIAIPYIVKNIRAVGVSLLQVAVYQIKEDKNDLSKAELEKVISELETALKIIESSENDFPQHIAPFLRESVAELKNSNFSR